MTAQQIEKYAEQIAHDDGFYVEARIGSNNYRNHAGKEPCRAVWRGARSNEPADVLIREMAIYIANRLHGEQEVKGGEG